MKYISLLLCILFVCTLNAQTIWRDTYLYGFTTSPRDIEVLGDSQFAIGGYHFDDTQNKRAFTLIIDAKTGEQTGFQDCETPVSCDGIRDVLTMKPDQTNNLYISGNKQFGSDYYVAKLNGTDLLDREWIRTNLEMDEIHHINQMEVVSDGIVLAGNFTSNEYSLIKLDFDGNTMWQHGFQVMEMNREPFFTTTLNDDIIFSFRSEIGAGSEFLSKINNSTGFIQWTRSYPNIFLHVASNSNDDLILVELLEDVNGQTLGLSKYDIDSGDKTVLNPDIGENYPTQMRIDPSNNIFLGGSYRHDDQTFAYALYLEEYNSEGQLVCTQDYYEMGVDDMVFDDNLNDMEIDQDGNVVLLGTRNVIDSGANRFALAILTNSCTNSSFKNTHENKSTIYPNPTAGQLNFSLNDILKIDVYDLQGRLIMQKKGGNSIDLSNIDNGLYLIKLYSKDNHQTHSVFKREH